MPSSSERWIRAIRAFCDSYDRRPSYLISQGKISKYYSSRLKATRLQHFKKNIEVQKANNHHKLQHSNCHKSFRKPIKTWRVHSRSQRSLNRWVDELESRWAKVQRQTTTILSLWIFFFFLWKSALSLYTQKGWPPPPLSLSLLISLQRHLVLKCRKEKINMRKWTAERRNVKASNHTYLWAKMKYID